MPVLYNIKYEQFCQLVFSGKPYEEAGANLGYTPRTSYSLMRKEVIQERIKELNKNAAIRAELSKADIITGMRTNVEKAELAGQHQTAINGLKLLGSELHGMFVDRKEIGGPGDFDNKSADELRKYIIRELASLGMALAEPPLQIEHQPDESERPTVEQWRAAFKDTESGPE